LNLNEIPMKKLISTMLAVVAFATAAFAGTEYATVYDYYPEQNATMDIYAEYWNSDSSYYVHVTNGADVDIELELVTGSHRWYVINNSSNTNVGYSAMNAMNYGSLTLDHLPIGNYTITMSSSYNAWTTTFVSYY
jgi:hypothetical protein